MIDSCDVMNMNERVLWWDFWWIWQDKQLLWRDKVGSDGIKVSCDETCRYFDRMNVRSTKMSVWHDGMSVMMNWVSIVKGILA